MLRVNQVKLNIDHSLEELEKKTAEILRLPVKELLTVRILRQSVDARKKPDIFYSYCVDVEVKNEDQILRRFRGKENLVCRSDTVPYSFPKTGTKPQAHPTVIAGMGPAGLFCGLFLALHGYSPILLERGKCVEDRGRDVEVFWETGVLNPASNVQFGEGGAGTFSDGKLNTLVKDRDGRNRAVLETFVRFGANPRICYEAKPHIGTDVLRDIVRRMREEIIRLGGQVRFESQVTDICLEDGQVRGVVVNGSGKIDCGQLVLAVGHSARDTFEMLYNRQIPMEAKAFAVGLRVQHPQAMINESQYGTAEPGVLGAAPYKVTAKGRNGRAVYSFCMCPGGYVVNASSEPGRTAVNGMSYSGRDGKNANSAIIVAVTPEDYRPEPGSDFGSGSEAVHPLAGIEFQRLLEQRAYGLSGGRIPMQRYGDFKECVEGMSENGSESEKGNAFAKEAGKAGDSMPDSDIVPQCRGLCQWADVSGILPPECNRAIVDGMENFGRQIKGFDRPDAILMGVESRTSSPVRICRDETLQSKVRGLYPCGEGAGYAGGITSAAMDGIKVAEAIAGEFAPFL